MNDDTATVLVVDDIPTKRYILASWLRRAGHRVVEAGGGEEALAVVDALRPDLVILDVRMPDLGGMEVCEKLKANPLTASIPVIQVSGNAITPADRAEGLERGADAYLSEPIQPDEFTATVLATLRYYRARQRAERMAARLSELAEITLAMNEAEDFERLLTVAAEGCSRLLERYSRVLAVPPDGRLRRFAARPGEPAAPRPVHPDTLERLCAFSIGEAAGVRVFEVDSEAWARVVPDSDVLARVSGVLCRTKTGRSPVYVGVETGARLDGEELSLLRQLGQALALAVDAARAYAEEHMISLTLQRSLLPDAIPRTPGLLVSVRYRPSVDNVEVGGDFYEVLPLGDRVLVALGDVQGHSLHAATVMAELRYALRASVIDSVDPARSMALLNAVLLRYHPGMTATVCLMLIDPATGESEIVNAGHIPPLLAGTGAAYHRFGDLLLGVVNERYRVDRVRLPENATVLLFTDGLIEDRDKLLDESLEVARKEAEDVGDDLDVFCDRLIATFGAREDDVALVALRRVPV
ncbi:fused response regulator/phosphatase [Microbispora sp. H11081]|uniref:fused response regulator/phosphatase n=1 Tax=Microbispora sp. H11081 TaxID=2729107 RepID=UPI0014736247|nr:fused response regulator/phosphatase [Microbispora sp. H11081]